MKTLRVPSRLKRVAGILGQLSIVTILVSAITLSVLQQRTIKKPDSDESSKEIDRLSNQFEDLGHRVQQLEMNAQNDASSSDFYTSDAATTALHEAINAQILAKYTQIDHNVVHVHLPEGHSLKSFDIPLSIWEKHQDRSMRWATPTEGYYEPDTWMLELGKSNGFRIQVHRLNQQSVYPSSSSDVLSCGTSSQMAAVPNGFLRYLEEEKRKDVDTLCSNMTKSAQPLHSIFHDAESKTYFTYTYIDPTTSSTAMVAGVPMGSYGFIIDLQPSMDIARYSSKEADQVKNEMRATADLFLTSAVHSICQNDYMGCY